MFLSQRHGLGGGGSFCTSRVQDAAAASTRHAGPDLCRNKRSEPTETFITWSRTLGLVLVLTECQEDASRTMSKWFETGPGLDPVFQTENLQ